MPDAPAQVPPGEPAAVVDLGAIAANLAVVRARLRPGTKVLAAVKADAYGHGLVPVARHLEELGVDWFGVATPGEALRLRQAGVAAGVLLLSPVREASAITALIDAGVSLTLPGDEALKRLRAADLPRRASVQLVVDTGMGRLGPPASEAAALAQRVAADPRLELAGVWTHFAASDSPDRTFTLLQLERFHEALEGMRRAGVEAPLVHAANSAATIAYPEAHFGMVRAGIVLYGHHASAWVKEQSAPLRPAMRLTAPITFVKRVSAGTTVSYGSLWRAPAPTTLATVRIGYADGYPRQLTGAGWVALRGRRCEIVGRVCMDQLMIDVGDLADVQEGERVTLWGEGGPDAERLAESFGTVSYELLTGVGARVPRVYEG